MFRGAVVLFFVVLSIGVGQTKLFDGVWRSYGKALSGEAIPLALTSQDAVAQGWKSAQLHCVPGMGFQYFDGDSEPHRLAPLAIWYNAKGNISGVSMYLFGGGAPSNLVNLGYWRKSPFDSDSYYLSVGFRSSDVCSPSSPDNNPVGDVVILNPDQQAGKLNYPLNEKDVYCGGFVQGSAMKCFGTHYFKQLDLHDPYNSSKLVPVGTMYWNETLTTFMIISPSTQTAIATVWDGNPLTGPLMCQNWCDDSCSWDAPLWSTLHIFLTSDYVNILPPNNEGPPVYRTCVAVNSYSC